MGFRFIGFSLGLFHIVSACAPQGPYPAEFQRELTDMAECKEFILQRGNAVPNTIRVVSSDTPDLYAGVYENGKPFECRLVRSESGQMVISVKYVRVKWGRP